MKKGLKGYAGCSILGQVWGVSYNTPNFVDLVDSGVQQIEIPYDCWGGWQNIYEITVHKTVVPEVSPRIPHQLWKFHAAKLPTSYPAADCEPYPLLSSAIDGGDGTFDVEIGTGAEHVVEYEGTEIEQHSIAHRYCFSSRAVCVNGSQDYLVYRLGIKVVNVASPSGVNLPKFRTFDSNPGYYGHAWLGDLTVVNVAAQEANEYFTGSLDGALCFETVGEVPGLSSTVMEKLSAAFVGAFSPDYVDVFVPGSGIYLHGSGFPLVYSVSAIDSNTGNATAAQCIQLGKEYAVFSGYNPRFLSGDGWGVVRIKYQGTRLGVSGLEVFGTDNSLGKEDTTYAGPYVILLPSVRTSIDTHAEQPDECWVCAKSHSGYAKLVTGRWLSKVYRPGIGGENETTGIADGTLSEVEAEAGNTIVDKGDANHQATQDFPDENWEDIRVYCYNRIWSHQQQENKDLLLFTTAGEVDKRSGLIADFETPEGQSFDPHYLNHGLEETELAFNAVGSNGNSWQTDNARNHTSGGSLAVRSMEQDVTKEGTCDLSLIFTSTITGQLKFWYMLDNRWYGTRIPPFNELTNFADPDNNLQVYLDGNRVPLTIDSTYFDWPENPERIGLIDNVNCPDAWDEESEYLTWRQVQIDVPPGTHTLRITLRRQYQDNGHLVAWIDDVELPEVMVGDDITGAKRWYYDGTKVRRAKYWTFAKRDEEDKIDVVDRLPTVPEFITLDNQGRIHYGNPSYQVCIRMDAGHEGELDESFGFPRSNTDNLKGGFLRWTASPNEDPTDIYPCQDPDWLPAIVDMVDDPNWGSFQILRAGDNLQTRGVNATLRDMVDAEHLPINKQLYTTKQHKDEPVQQEIFSSRLKSQGRWCQRPSAWDISHDGKLLVPHLEVIWRPTHDQMAWPVAPPYPHPPYTSNFENSDIDNNEWYYNSARPHDARTLLASSDKIRWSPINWLIPRMYSDCLSRRPQFVWVSNSDDPPSNDDDPNWWDPDWDHNTAQGLGVRGGPWGSAIWRLVQARQCPVGHFSMQMFYTEYKEELCDVESEEEGGGVFTVSAVVWRQKFREVVMFWTFTDFDAVDGGCSTCCGG